MFPFSSALTSAKIFLSIWIEQDFWLRLRWNPQPSDLIHDGLDHRTTVSCYLHNLLWLVLGRYSICPKHFSQKKHLKSCIFHIYFKTIFDIISVIMISKAKYFYIFQRKGKKDKCYNFIFRLFLLFFLSLFLFVNFFLSIFLLFFVCTFFNLK